jgi:hypothetical protein
MLKCITKYTHFKKSLKSNEFNFLEFWFEWFINDFLFSTFISKSSSLDFRSKLLHSNFATLAKIFLHSLILHQIGLSLHDPRF